jgi:uncharacterized protein involved in exopolysaccharide biosynthesis
MRMSERTSVVDDETMRFGLLMESAQAHQKLAETHLEKLRAHTEDLDDVVRDEIRRTLVEELKSLTAESERAARALRDMKRTVQMRSAIGSIVIAVLCTAIPGAIAHWMLPSLSDIAALRAQRDALAQNIAHLEQRGGKVDWRSCGDLRQLCVRVDRRAPIFGDKADYYIVKGY